jgi:shikimate kinase
VTGEFDRALNYAMQGSYKAAMKTNGRTYGKAMGLDTSVSEKAMDLGAVSAGISGTGPATVILCEEDLIDEIRNGIEVQGEWIQTELNSEKAKVL